MGWLKRCILTTLTLATLAGGIACTGPGTARERYRSEVIKGMWHAEAQRRVAAADRREYRQAIAAPCQAFHFRFDRLFSSDPSNFMPELEDYPPAGGDRPPSPEFDPLPLEPVFPAELPPMAAE